MSYDGDHNNNLYNQHITPYLCKAGYLLSEFFPDKELYEQDAMSNHYLLATHSS